MKKILENESYLLLISFLSISFFYLWDLGNIDGLRQGTEGFYLQIAKEMFETPSYLTPLYLGNEHWSKPPFLFWLSMPFFALKGSSSLFLARLSVTLFSFFSTFLISNWIKKHFHIERSITLIFLLSTIGFLKYSRIFMMEIPLTLLSVLASLYFYDYLNSSHKKDLLVASLALGLAILVKGPVAFVMCVGGSGLFLLYKMFQEKKIILGKITQWSCISLVLSSIWFLICYLKYGSYFLEYFFLRENLGKFTAASYPIRSVFQGLLIYGLPWSLFAPFIYFYTKRNNNQTQSQVYLFLCFNFLFFFILWLIPNQRSHHYAIPSLPFFLLMILIAAFTTPLDQKKESLKLILNRTLGIILFLIAVLISLTLSFDYILKDASLLARVILSLIALISSSFIFIRKNSSQALKYHSSLISFGFIWVILAPAFYLSSIPEKIVKATKNYEVAGVVRKPYFVEEALQKKILALDPAAINSHIDQNNQHLYIVHESLYKERNLAKKARILERWPIWKRGRKVHHIYEAMQARNLSLLQENMLLIKPHNLD